MAPKVKIPPADSLRKMSNLGREDPLHPNYNKPLRVPAKRNKTNSSRAEQYRSFHVQKVHVSDNAQFEAFLNNPVEEQGTRTTDKEGCREDNNNESNSLEIEVDKYGPRDSFLLTSFKTHRAKAIVLGQDPGCLRVFHHSLSWDIGKEVEKVQTLVKLVGLRVGGDLTVVQDKWGATNVKQVFRDYLFQSDKVYFNLKAEGQGISLSLVKLVDFFAYKLKGRNAHDRVEAEVGEASSSSKPVSLSSREVAKAYMLNIIGSFFFSTKKGTDVSAKYLNFCDNKNSDITWPRGAAALTHLYYSLGDTSRVNGKVFSCCTTLLESWIFEHFPKLPEIPKPNHSRTLEYCTRWSLTRTTTEITDEEALKMFREALENYKLEDVEKISVAWKRISRIECDSLKEAYNRLEADIQAKELVDSICVKDYSETIKKLNDKLNLVTISEGNVLRVQDWNKKYNELNAKYEEAQRKLSERDKNVS
ncbi:hypothetical protein GIB67_043239 [Kingdonia uniflora]|uniref:Aminotransferase-like plant mobile domain-containing protein n=1 Tax=Kingdonia uniflora TaxID=39325 RepID=A0A7J7L2H7_9MAGN|nr:hypothetical protein GIB67_043239 [Kingdonia uniflora]